MNFIHTCTMHKMHRSILSIRKQHFLCSYLRTFLFSSSTKSIQLNMYCITYSRYMVCWVYFSFSQNFETTIFALENLKLMAKHVFIYAFLPFLHFYYCTTLLSFVNFVCMYFECNLSIKRKTSTNAICFILFPTYTASFHQFIYSSFSFKLWRNEWNCQAKYTLTSKFCACVSFNTYK